MLASAVPARAATDCLQLVRDVDLQRATIPQLQAEMANRRLSSVDLVRAYRQRIAAYDGKLGAILTLNPRAYAQARELDRQRRLGRVKGPLHGVPILLKDNIDTREMPTTAGSVVLRGNRPRRDATVVRRLRAEGAIILGKDNMAEFADAGAGLGSEGSSTLGGRVRNPYNGGSPASSSSGSAVAVAMSFAAASVGSDTGGSVIFPARENLVVGLRATTGLVPRAGLIPFLPSRDAIGPITRSVTDAAVMLDAMTGRRTYLAAAVSRPLDGLRVGVRTGEVLGDSPTARQRRPYVDALRAAGAEIVELGRLSVNLGLTNEAEFARALSRYLRTEASSKLSLRTLGDVIRAKRRITGTTDQLLSEKNRAGDQSELELRRNNRRDWEKAQRSYLTAFDRARVDFLAYASGEEGARSGMPTITVPTNIVREDDVVHPTGMVLLGRPKAEAALLRLARTVEAGIAPRKTPFETQTTPLRPRCPAPTP